MRGHTARDGRCVRFLYRHLQHRLHLRGDIPLHHLIAGPDALPTIRIDEPPCLEVQLQRLFVFPHQGDGHSVPFTIVHREGERVGEILFVNVDSVVVVSRMEIGITKRQGEVPGFYVSCGRLGEDPPIGGGMGEILRTVNLRYGLHPPIPYLRVQGTSQSPF